MEFSNYKLRGNYNQALPDFTAEQDYGRYTAADQQTWRTLYQRQRMLTNRLGCAEFNCALSTLEKSMNFDTSIPNLAEVNKLLSAATGWSLVAVPGLIPDRAFFNFLAKRQFPVTVWIRHLSELDYIVEPDIFHDFFGHIPMLFDPAVADFLMNYGLAAAQADHGELQKLARLYWYTIEFGLIKQSDGIKAFGAGLLSSASELQHAIQCEQLHLAFNKLVVRQTRYLIDTFQSNYFVLPSIKVLHSIH
jgi:phenylalanine-4-hydroxylase